MAPRLRASQCPNCGAGLKLDPKLDAVQCQYCGTVLHVEHRKRPPPTQQGPVRPNTVYVQPQAGRMVAGLIIAVTLSAILLPVGMVVGPMLLRRVGSAVQPFPANCGMNEELKLSGDYKSDGVLIEAAHNCKIVIEDSKLEAKSLIDSGAFNVELTLKNVTLVTSETSIRLGSNAKIKIEGGSVQSKGWILDVDSNPQLEIKAAKLDAGEGIATESVNLKLNAEQTTFKAAKTAFEIGSNGDFRLKKGVEINAGEVAFRADSNLQIKGDGTKIEAGEALVVGDSSTRVTLDDATLKAKRQGFVVGSSSQLVFEGGSLDVQEGSAVEARSSSVTLSASGTKIQSAKDAFTGTSNNKLKLTKKAQLVSVRGSAFVAEVNADVTVEDSVLKGAKHALVCDTNCKVRAADTEFTSGSGALRATGNAQIELEDTRVNGGTGPALSGSYNARIRLLRTTAQGTPALSFERRPNQLELEQSNLIGGQRIGQR